MSDPAHNFVGRGALKLIHALDAFALDVAGLACADFGANIGGFTDALLSRGAARVTTIDTGYGNLAWKLRTDPRVTVLERTNALHTPPPTNDDDRMDLIVIDMGWTTQDACIPAAMKWLKPGGCGRIITLIKPHYEARRFGMEHLLRAGILDEADAQTICDRVVADLPSLGVLVRGITKSPIAGGAGKGKKKGNTEWLALLTPSKSE